MFENGVFRKKISFTMVPNEVSRNRNLTLKAKGLYLYIMSYITYEGFNLTKSFLRSNSVEGEKAFDTIWNELKRAGYLKIYFLRNSNGKFRAEYELLETATEPEKHTFYCDENGDILSNNLDRKEKMEKRKEEANIENNLNLDYTGAETREEIKVDKKTSEEIVETGTINNDISYEDISESSIEESDDVLDKPISENKKEVSTIVREAIKKEPNNRTPFLGVTVENTKKSTILPYPPFGRYGKHSNGKEGNNNNTIYNTNSNTNIENLNKTNNILPTIHPNRTDGKMESIFDNKLEELKKSVNYYSNFSTDSEDNLKKDFDEVLKIIASTLIPSTGKVKVNQNYIDLSMVKEKFEKLKFEHIRSIVYIVKNKKDYEIKNLRAFILTVAYNIVDEIPNELNLIEKHKLYYHENIKIE